ncbi:cephalosporin-C deacetylase-like acetyl esterase [Roseimicrobium gellanilyticum]|uniref:Cephalosporin-C deacetylase-like acetyl esterase n=2 Tax=Roseimicrobium gellanilyticum TaxID=748857 RepID=A0A366HTI5_9BACT|nr:cephalosporin-C deacetylase-like acetyl esterase [Roseimicrobium gellanilyticum]
MSHRLPLLAASLALTSLAAHAAAPSAAPATPAPKPAAVTPAAVAPAKPLNPFVVRADKENATYKTGEPVNFTIALAKDSPAPREAEITWSISKDGVPPIINGKGKLVDGKAVATASLNEPGFLLCRVSWNQDGKVHSSLGGAAVDPLLIKPSLPVPDDFDAFWDAQKKKLAAVPVKATMTPVPPPATIKKAETFDVKVDALGAPVSGYLARPLNAKPKSLPIVLMVHGAGVSSSSLAAAASWAENGMLAFNMNAHGIPNGKAPEYYTGLAQSELKDYRNVGRDSRETCYFLGMFLREVRALDFLCSQPEWDGKTVVVYGSSQGGFQGFAISAIDPRVTFLAAGVPAGCDHTGVIVNRVNGWPKIVPNLPDGKPDPKVLEASRYFDNVNFAAKTKAKGAYLTVGFIDTTCPPTGVYAAYNALPISKAIYDDIPSGHANSPQASAAMVEAVRKHVKENK